MSFQAPNLVVDVVDEVIELSVVGQIPDVAALLAGAEASATAGLEQHRANEVHEEPQPPIIGDGPDEAVAGDDPRLTDQRVPTNGSVTPAKLHATTTALFDPAGSAAAATASANAQLATKAHLFTTTALKTASYAALAWEIVRCDISSASFAVTLPTGAALGDTIVVKVSAVSSTNTVTIQTAGADVINVASTSVTIKLLDEALTFVSDGAGRWIIGSGHKSLASLQALFAAIDAVPTVYQAYISSVVVTNSSLAAIAVESGYVWAVVDQSGRIAWGIKPDGTVTGKITPAAGSLTVAQMAADVLSRLVGSGAGSYLQYMQDENATYAFAIVDTNGRIAFAVKADGTITANTTLADGSVTTAKLAANVAALLPGTLGTESGYAWAVVDQNGRAALTIANDGTVSGKLAVADASVTRAKLAPDVTAVLPQTLGVESGYVWAVVDENGRLGLGIKPDGSLSSSSIFTLDRSATAVENANYLIEPFLDSQNRWQLRSHPRSDGAVIVLTTSGNNIDPRITEDDRVLYRSDQSGVLVEMVISAAGGTAYPAIPLLAGGIAFWGDSLTAGAGGNGTTPASVAAAMLGVTTINYGIGGQTSPQIAARQGGAPSLLTVTGNSIPASGAVNVTALSVRLLSTAASSAANSLTGTLAGVAGTLAKDTSDNYTFTRTAAAASATACPAGTPFIPDIGTAQSVHAQILWLGRNNLGSSSQVQSDTAACAAYLKTFVKRYLVLSILNGGSEGTGTTNYNSIAALNSALASTYGNRYLDVRRYLIDHGLSDAGITPTSQDTTDIANDVVPTSLRADSIHLTAAGYTVVGQQIANKITTLGWT
jgi:lysophospholipase L1-like esterase